jgi:hypothetical protein
MELFMIYKISPHPSFPSGPGALWAGGQRGEEKRIFAKEGERKGRNDQLDYVEEPELKMEFTE